jgi:hypothetical protein
MDIGQNSICRATADDTLLLQCADLSASLESLSDYATADYTDYAVESLDVILKKLSAIHQDFTGRIARIFAVTPKRFTTEYVEWYRKNVGLISKVEKCSFDKLKTCQIDIPTGMTGTYPEVVQDIQTFFGQISIQAVIAQATKVNDAVQVMISQGSRDGASKLSSAAVAAESKFKQASSSYANLIAKFDDVESAVEKREFGSQFRDTKDLVAFRTELAKANDVLAGLPKVGPALAALEKNNRVCVDYIVDASARGADDFTATPQFVQQFARYLSVTDGTIAKFGDVAIRLMAVTHNTALMYKSLSAV